MRKSLALLLLVAFLAGCGGSAASVDPNDRKVPPTPPAVSVDAAAVAAHSRYGIDLLKAVAAESTRKGANTFLSPLSASLILSLTAGGARGETQQEMLRALRLDGLPMAQIHQANQDLQTILTNDGPGGSARGFPDPKVEVTMANAIWYRTDLQAAPTFVAMAQERYAASVEGAAFGEPEATQRINDWTAQATRGKIPKLLEATDESMAMVLVNALYFKGEWSHSFDPKLTQEGSFTRLDESQESQPFMQQEGSFDALQGEGFRAVRLPYGQGRVAMYLFVPQDLPAFVAGLTAERWESYLNSFTPQRGEVIIPRVKLEATHELNKPMQALGMNLAFDWDQADFSGLFTDGQKKRAIRLILQKTFLEIDEEGTEAAAATAVIVTDEAAREPLVRADRPFLLAIRDDETGALLFIGTIVDP